MRRAHWDLQFRFRATRRWRTNRRSGVILMMPTDKITEAEVEDANSSAIQRFDRFMSSVYSRKEDDTYSLEDSAHEGAGIEPHSLSDNGDASLAGSERLRAEIITRAREAEEREREATERYKQLE